VQLTDLLNFVSHIWTPPPKIHGKQRMIIPSIKDLRSSRESDKVKSQCQDCAKQLASHLYIWRKHFPEKSTVKTWNKKSLSFLSMDIDIFANYLMQHFDLRTDDNHEWLLDRAIADLIWRACTAADSPLPPASWQVETDLKRKAIR
jgi:hypothetical protein